MSMSVVGPLTYSPESGVQTEPQSAQWIAAPTI